LKPLSFVVGERNVAQRESVHLRGSPIGSGILPVQSRASAVVVRVGVIDIVDEGSQVRGSIAFVGVRVASVGALVALLSCAEDPFDFDLTIDECCVAGIGNVVASAGGRIALIGGSLASVAKGVAFTSGV
jgi:hypothetical protein